MSIDITELTQLRKELSNPAIGSKDHLRKLALSLIDELEELRSQINTQEDFIRGQDQLIADLKRNWQVSMQRVTKLEESHAQVIQSRDHYKRISEEGLKQLSESRTAMSEVTEIDPRDAFEEVFPIPIFCIRCGDGYASTSFNGWDANTHKARWEGWKAASGIIKSRTFTVKLPQRYSMLLREDLNEDYHTEMAYKADEVQASLTAAGIKLEVELWLNQQ